MTKMILLPEELVQEIERRAALEGKSVDDTAAAVVRQGLETSWKSQPEPFIVDAAMLEERRKIAEKFVTGEWSVDVDVEAFEQARAKEKAEAEALLNQWSE